MFIWPGGTLTQRGLMDWFSAALAALSGGLALYITNLFVSNPKEKKVTYVVVAVFSFAVLSSLSRVYILPELKALAYWLFSKLE
jgi:hypothetical protein